MPDRILEIFKKYMKDRFPYTKDSEAYYTEWQKRFADGWEWQKSDYAGRLTLQKIAPEIYPKAKDEFFQRVD